MTRSHRWPREKIEAMRKELLEDGMTLQEVADREGYSPQRISQIIGPLGRDRNWKIRVRGRNNQERVRKLAEAGKSDKQIAAETGLSKSTIANHRLAAGIRRPHGNKKHTAEHIIWCARKWAELFGYTPAATDWNPALAKSLGHLERAERCHKFRAEFGAPPVVIVQRLFGSWSEMIRQAELPPSPIGFDAIGRFSDARKRMSGWALTIPDGGWTKKAILAKEQEWEDHFGFEPCPSDWGCGRAFVKGSYKEGRLARFRELNPPKYSTVRVHFGSFGAMLEEARKRRQAAG